MNTYEWAQAYARLGWHLHPLLPRSKRPPYGTHGYLDAQPAATFWRSHPNYNIAAACGASQIVVLDIDPRHGGSLAAVVERLGQAATDTVQQRSGGGGWHIFYQLPAGCTIRKAQLPELPGCEVLGAGRSIVLTPSIHPGGGLYRWAAGCSPFECGMLLLPSCLSDMLQEQHRRWPVTSRRSVGPQCRSAYGRAMLRGCLDELRGLAEGERNDKLYLVSLRLGRAVAGGLLDERVVRGELAVAGHSLGLPGREVQDTVRSGLQAGLRRPLPSSPL